MTQAQLTEAADLSTTYVSQIEAGKRVGRVDSLQAIAGALEVGLDELTPRIPISRRRWTKLKTA